MDQDKPKAAWIELDLIRHEPAVCERFVRSHYRNIFSFLYSLSGDTQRAADLTQETFAAFWESLKRVKVREPVLWLFQIARNRWRKSCRENMRRTHETLDETKVRNHEKNPCDAAAATELSAIIGEAVSQLPTNYREVVLLRYWHGWDYKEIAKIEGIPVTLARWRTYQGKKILRGLLNGKI